MLEKMVEMASAAMKNAHAVYSGFSVGACVRTDSDQLFAGCNVENSSYPEGNCAETSAIAAMVTAGEKHIAEVVVVSSGDAPCMPCGGCRQRLYEFSGPETLIHIWGTDSVAKTMTVSELLPEAFCKEIFQK